MISPTPTVGLMRLKQADVEAILAGQLNDFHGGFVNTVMMHEGVAQAVTQAKAAGVNFFAILAAILPFVVQFITTGTVDWQAVIAAITALFGTPVAQAKAKPRP
jgi:hypothetical protein